MTAIVYVLSTVSVPNALRVMENASMDVSRVDLEIFVIRHARIIVMNRDA